MALKKITSVVGTCISVPGDDIDTDRIIPARFMKCVTFDGLGEFLFYDVRFDENQKPKPHPLNDPKFKQATILLSGNNFGCGSSREHAPQALYRYGIRAVLAEGFAEIFFGNSTTLGMPCVSANRQDIQAIRDIVEKNPSAELTIDLVNQKLHIESKTFPCSLRESARDALINGRWDAIGELLEASEQVDTVAEKLPYLATA
ncbi:MAG: 3-isopropylmalate dehydratase small subunit [Verrucomicrobiae bacterium]|nr:3-isopropylmalate dehydratase small subunit [Verrucomicrobiae bacterium]